MLTIAIDHQAALDVSTNAAAVSPQAVVLVAAGMTLLAVGAASTLTRLHTAVVTTLVDFLVGAVKVLAVVVVLLVLWLMAEHEPTDEAPPQEVSVRP